MNGTASTAVVVVVAVFFFGTGVYALVDPTHLAAPFHPVATPEGRSEVRAVNGGFGIAVALMLGVAAVDTGDLRRGITFTVAAALAGMALGRVISRAAGDRTRFYPVWFYGCIEAIGAAVLAAWQ